MQRSHPSRGFTLVELLVSIVIALLMVLGVNEIFKRTTKMVGVGHAVLAGGRDARTFLRTMYVDMTNLDQVAGPYTSVGDPICFIIQSQHVSAFRNVEDQQSATNPTQPFLDTNLFNSSVYPGNKAPVPLVHFRSHRVDQIGFFANGIYPRQTSSTSTSFISTTSGAQAWIIYGHAQQPNKGALLPGAVNSGWYGPGAKGLSTANNNDYNFLASDWMLARLAVLLVPSPNTTTDPIYLPDTGGLNPLMSTSPASGAIANEGGGIPTLFQSRIDIAQTSIANFGSASRTVGAKTYTNGLASYAVGQPNGPTSHYLPNPTGTGWWTSLINPSPMFRIQASPYVVPIVSASAGAPKLAPYGLAKSAPCLIRGCTQFIVEYAGNFYTKNTVTNDGTPIISKDANGNALPPVPDPSGQLDYFIDAGGCKRIRWYGFPRLVNAGLDNATVSNVAGGTPLYPPPTSGNIAVDTTYGKGGSNAVSDAVVPLRDILESFQPGWGKYADAERFGNGFPAVGSGNGNNYWTLMDAAFDASNPYIYTAAWGPDNTQPFPKMIRIVICIDDRAGLLSQPQFFEYIYDVQQ